MNRQILLATAARTLRQLSRDHRTVAMILFLPSFLLTILYYMYRDNPLLFQSIATIMLGILPFVVMFLITSIAMLRERTSGTLERLMASPLNKLDLLFGYGVAFGLAAAGQALVTITVVYWAFDVRPTAGVFLVVVIALVNAALGVALGLFTSAFARTEFQAVQFMPLVAMPQILLCGLFVPRDQMAVVLQGISDALPLTYGVEALQEIASATPSYTTIWSNAGLVAAVSALSLALAAATLRRRTP
ncbi:ABC transporter permease [Hoyosella subflava]|uniref:Transport permease protein n=1 Tax=Hoyosella subflava (strain DSM 45089 / JCM 17490 / NBRC 109087 / DQS3-9A1) TaxID=443218 RepID=F6ES37_HOYSD|nr:ABC transporter permease [Hoyosella subflava]AEF42041.1 Putative ABC transporter efflux protein, DrrB family [Hoyosella subflava DQS3-9A1]